MKRRFAFAIILAVLAVNSLSAQPDSSAQCIECHSKITPNIVSDWKLSKHSQVEVSCVSCHGDQHTSASDVVKVKIPTPDTCATCHQTQVEQFRKGKHSAAWAATEPIVEQLLDHFPDCHFKKPWLSACFPGHGVDFHTDKQPENFVTRIHCPIITNPDARINVEGTKYFPKVGLSYKVDTRKTHGVKNDGKETRIHFIFDIMRKEECLNPELLQPRQNADVELAKA